MKIVVFGASGRTGQHVVEQALEKGHQVMAYARSPGKLSFQDENLSVIEGDIQDGKKVSQAIDGVDAVISTLAPTSNRPEFVVSAGIENILNGMKEHGVSRIVVTTGAGVGDPNDDPKFINKFINFILRMTSKYVFEDMLKTTQIVRGSDVDWTIVRVPMLGDDPATGNVKAAWVGKGMGFRIGRADLAAFLLDQLEDDTYLHQAPAVSN